MRGERSLVAALAALLVIALPGAGHGQTASADLRVAISGPRDGAVGQTLVYAVSITNAGPAQADDVVASFNVPSQFADATVSLSRGACDGQLRCGLFTMPAGSESTGTLSVRIVSRQQTIIGFSARSATPDPTPDANSVSVPVFFPAPPPPPPAGPDPGVPALADLPVALVGRPYSARLAVSGGGPPYQFSLGACGYPPLPPPAGFAVSTDGVVTFAPTVVGNWEICFVVRDSYRGGRFFQGIKSVLRVRDPLVVRKPAAATTGAAYDSPFVRGGQPPYQVTFRSGRLPPGVRETDLWTRLVGRPRVSGTFAFHIDVQDSYGLKASGAWVLRVRVGRGLPVRVNEMLTPGRTTGGSPRCDAAPPPDVGGPLRAQVLAAYQVVSERQRYAIDRLIPVELGGHPTHVSNLWPQLATRAARTDRFERLLLDRVCAGGLTLDAARERIKQHKLRVG